jgi:hypothetical protein
MQQRSIIARVSCGDVGLHFDEQLRGFSTTIHSACHERICPPGTSRYALENNVSTERAANAEERAANAEEGAANAEEGAANAEEGAANAEEGAANAELHTQVCLYRLGSRQTY